MQIAITEMTISDDDLDIVGVILPFGAEFTQHINRGDSSNIKLWDDFIGPLFTEMGRLLASDEYVSEED